MTPQVNDNLGLKAFLRAVARSVHQTEADLPVDFHGVFLYWLNREGQKEGLTLAEQDYFSYDDIYQMFLSEYWDTKEHGGLTS